MTQDPLLDKIHKLWLNDKRREAIDELLHNLNKSLPEIPRSLGLRLAYYVFLLGDYAAAERFLRRLTMVYPDDAELVLNLAVSISRQKGRFRESLELYERLARLEPDWPQAWDGLANNYSRCNSFDKARLAGERALDLKSKEAKQLSGWSPPSETIREFLLRDGYQDRKDCISFSLWGSEPQYLRGALRNVLLIPELYPGWVARFYLDDSVPSDFINLLRNHGAEIRHMPIDQNLRQKLCRRFLVASDPGVNRFLVRDCDSVISQREVGAVKEWIASDHWFHIMRDWWTHTDPMLAGLWGGVSNTLPRIDLLIEEYVSPSLETPNVDQWFLREILWGSIRHHCLIHDRCYRSEASQRWPDLDPDGDMHVGQNEFAARQSQQALWLDGWISKYKCLQLTETTTNITSPIDSHLQQKYVTDKLTDSFNVDLLEFPQGVTGMIVSLPEQVSRWKSISSQIEELRWQQTHQRYPALIASLPEAKEVGLRSGGELGLWRTTVALLESWLSQDPGSEDILHIIEDDAILNKRLPILAHILKKKTNQLDILFSESFLTCSLFQRFCELEEHRRNSGDLVWLINGGQYLGCTSSYFLTKEGARKLLNEMKRREGEKRIMPIDMVIRECVRNKRLKAAVSLPFFSTISTDFDSSLHTSRESAIKVSQKADLCLRRFLYFDNWCQERCSDTLSELSSILGAHLDPSAIAVLMTRTLDLGRELKWLEKY